MTNYTLNPAAFDAAIFIKQHWQRQPCVVRRAFLHFEDPLSADELAGVALEPGVDSRVVSRRDGEWDLVHGPLEDYSDFGENGWSLLVQAVNEHFPPAQALIEPFRFLPDWRIDDLMVSYSRPGGGVGAHIDAYDVFIIQGQGRRRWQIGPRGDYAVVTPHPDLKQIEDFEPFIDEVLEPGDMIYIPAGFPHRGESLTECFNYSVGFRAPSQAELFSALADFALEHDALSSRYQDCPQALHSVPAENARQSWQVTPAMLKELRTHMSAALNDETLLEQVLMKHLSQNPRPPLVIWPESPVTHSGLLRYLEQYDTLQRAVGVRMLTSVNKEQVTGWIQGHALPLDHCAEAVFIRLLNASLDVPCDEILALLREAGESQSAQARELLKLCLNEGFWFAINTEE